MTSPGPSLRRRADAALRIEPLTGRWGHDLGSRDPLASWPVKRGPSTFSMTPDERRSYAAYLMQSGWLAYEVRQVLAPPEVAA
jgi:hypothetical protein